jgi:hypothetical protein
LIYYTATALINDSITDIAILRPGQVASDDLLQIGLRSLNQLLDAWLLNALLVPAQVANSYPLTAAVSYTIGPTGADFTAPRPTGIEEANIILNTFTPSVRKPLYLANAEEWAAIRVQGIPNNIPSILYYDKGFDATNGFGTINLWPQSVPGYLLELYTWQQLQSFPDLTTAIKLPPGYARAIRKNLAVELAPTLQMYFKVSQPMLAAVKQQADQAKREIENYNAPDALLRCDPAFRGSSRAGGWNYFDGTTGGVR